MAKRNNSDANEAFHDYDIHVPSRTIYVGSVSSNDEHDESGTDFAMAERLIKNMHILETINKEPIVIILNNLGGDYYHGMALYDRIKASPCHVTVEVYGQAMSMGSLILQSADRRVMSPNATLMIHYGQASMDTTSLNFQQWAKEFKRIDKVAEEIYLTRIKEKHADYKTRDLKKLLAVDTFFTAEQALDLGLIDEVSGNVEAKE